MNENIIEDRNGNIFLDFFDKKESEFKNFSPPTHALIVVKKENKFLLVYDKWKEQWELPGGMIEENESTRDCIIRELREETNQQVKDLSFRGIMKFKLQPDYRIEYGALYTGYLEELDAFEETDEIREITLWNKEDEIKDLNKIDKKLLDFYQK